MTKDFITEQELLHILNNQDNFKEPFQTSLAMYKLKILATNIHVKQLEDILVKLMDEFPDISTGEIIKNIVESKGLKPKQIIAKSGISKDYYSKIISGKRKPSRNKSLQLCFGLGLTPDEANEFLKKMGHNELYLRNEYDFILYAALFRKLTYSEVEDLLHSLGYDTLVNEK